MFFYPPIPSSSTAATSSLQTYTRSTYFSSFRSNPTPPKLIPDFCPNDLRFLHLSFESNDVVDWNNNHQRSHHNYDQQQYQSERYNQNQSEYDLLEGNHFHFKKDYDFGAGSEENQNETLATVVDIATTTSGNVSWRPRLLSFANVSTGGTCRTRFQQPQRSNQLASSHKSIRRPYPLHRKSLMRSPYSVRYNHSFDQCWQHDVRFRRYQLSVNSFFEYPNGRLAIFYHLMLYVIIANQ